MLFWFRRIETIDNLIVGIGNPGPEYARTRHNVGFRVVNLLAKQLGVKKEEAMFKGIFSVAKLDGLNVGLLKPMTYVNLSGRSVHEAVNRFGLATEQILVILDDAQLPLGKLRLRAKGSSGGHKGLQSIIEALQTENIPRLRIGIGSPPEGVDMATYVLSPFEPEEESVIAEIVETAAEAAKVWVKEGIEIAMQRFNR